MVRDAIIDHDGRADAKNLDRSRGRGCFDGAIEYQLLENHLTKVLLRTQTAGIHW
jgi:hypothetical protein